tara:strand:- start:454 stop:681 length:228 start_codon:yes stop_codon:yes gene_type:complete
MGWLSDAFEWVVDDVLGLVDIPDPATAKAPEGLSPEQLRQQSQEGRLQARRENQMGGMQNTLLTQGFEGQGLGTY